MCIMIYKPAEEVLTEEGLTRCWDNNPDGGGVSYAHHGRIHTFKTMDQTEWVEYIMNHMDKELVLHARYTTMGATNLQNCHPFAVGKHSVCFMNGTMNHIPEEEMRSDTRIFCEDIASRLPDDWADNPAIFELTRQYAGDAKLLFLYDDGRVNILNEDLGNWVDGCWHSNEWYTAERWSSYSTGVTYGTKADTSWYDSGFDDDDDDLLLRQQRWLAEWDDDDHQCHACDAPLIGDHEIMEGICEDCVEYLGGSYTPRIKDIASMSDDEVEQFMKEMC